MVDTLPSSCQKCDIDLLIGNDYYADIESMKSTTLKDGLCLLGSKLGWILSAQTQFEDSSAPENSLAALTFSSSQLAARFLDFTKTEDNIPKEPNLEDFWKLETIGIRKSPTISDDDKAISESNKSIKMVNERYRVYWPWREVNPDLPNNYKLVYGRLNSVVKRLRENPEMLKMYNNVIKDQLNNGIIESVDYNSIQGKLKHYIPQHTVVKPNKKTTKLQIVYDAAAKTKKSNVSLNKCLYRGPVILEDFCPLLMRFQSHKVVLVADIGKAFPQVDLQEKDRDVARFLWLKDITKPVITENIAVLRFTGIPFGVISSQFILAAAKKIKKDIYVDNLITGTNTDRSALQIYLKGKKIFQEM